MKVKDVMTENVKFCRPDTNLAEAIAVMWEYDCGALPVVVDDKEAVGVVTDRDIAIAVGTKHKPAWAIPVSEAMSKELYAVSPEDDIHTALKLMRKDRIRRLPVLNAKGALEGILCLNDIALHADYPNDKKTPELNYLEVVSTLKAICEHRHPILEEQYKSASA